MTKLTHDQKVIAGYKATLHNDTISSETKASTIHKLEELGFEVDSEYAVYVKGEMPSGAKHHRDSSGGSGSHADADTSTSTTGSGLTDEEKHEHRVIGGLKAALHNPNTTADGLERTKKQLRAHGIDPEDVPEPAAK